jgi:hypothetical protein
MNYKYFSKRIKCLIYITLISFAWCFGQNTKSAKEYAWVNFGLGGSSNGPSAGISGSYQIKYHVISLRALYNEEIGIWDNFPDNSSDMGLLYGLGARKKFFNVSISTGISRVSGSVITYSDERKYAVVGIPIELQFFHTGKIVGIGIYGFANINRELSFVGGLLCIQLGKLR